MKFSLKSIATFSALSALAIAPVFLSADAASALPAGMDGAYIGGGFAAGVTSSDGGDTTSGGNIQGRVAIPSTPLSARGSILFSDDTSALMPILTYDLPVSNSANLYAGAGYSFVEKDGQASPLGDQDAFVLTTGAEAAIARNVVLYGDVKLGLDAFQDSSDPAVSLQFGAGYRF
jgi:hypothetical protein